MAGRLEVIGRALVVAAPAAARAVLGKYSMAEVAMHSDAESCWVVVEGEVRGRFFASPVAGVVVAASAATSAGLTVSADDCWLCWFGLSIKVYDVTAFLDEHPGGKALLLSVGGTDATTTFNGIHPDLAAALSEGERYKIGVVVSEEEAPPPVALPEAPSSSALSVDTDAVGGGAIGGEVHFHLPDSIKDMTPEQLAALSAGAGEAMAAAAPSAHSPSDADAVAPKPLTTDTEGLAGSGNPSWNSGGTSGALPAERALASFDVEKMINILDGGEEETKKRRWIIGAGDIAASSELFGAAKYDLPRDGPDGAIASAFEHFMRVHGPWLEQMYVPTGNETMYMSMGNMMGGCALPPLPVSLGSR